jgi:hypothetical protein
MMNRYLIYRTDFGNTIVRESAVSGTTGVNEQELYSSGVTTGSLIPAVQPLYLWSVSGGTIVVPNTEEWIGAWEVESASEPAENDLATIGFVTGSTGVLENYTGNGIISGFYITINDGVSATTINISSGEGYIVDNHTNPNLPVRTKVIYSGQTGISLTYRTTNLVTYLAVDSGATVVQQTTPYTNEQRRDYILLGAAIHSNLLYVNAINNLPDVVLDSHNQLNDLMDGLRNFNYEGNKFTANGPNLQINKSIGKIIKKGVNFSTSNRNPHRKTMPALTAPSNIRYRLSDGTEYADTNSIDPAYYESPLGVKTAVPVNSFSIQRIVLFSSNLVRIQYGQAVYNTMALAAQALATEPFAPEANIVENGLFRAFLIVKGSTTSLQDPASAMFVETDKFGTMPLGISGGVTNLQQAYDNSLDPEIVTTVAQGALTVRRGTAADTDDVFDIMNGSSGITASIKGDGTARFDGGVVTGNIRPTGDTTSAIRITNANNTTPVVIIDTVSGFTGFGTIPDNLLHTYGTYNAEEYAESMQKNAIVVDGVVDGDKDVAWADGGAIKWTGEIFRNEKGKFWYLYNIDGEISPITTSESGRIGFNSPTNVMNYPARTVSGSSTTDLAPVITGLYDKNYIAVYQIAIDGTGATDTYIWRKSSDLGLTYGGWSASSGVTTGATVFDSGIEISFVELSGRSIGDAWQIPAFPQLAPATVAITANRLNKVLYTHDYTASAVTYNDITEYANVSDSLVEFTIFQSGETLNAVYTGTLTPLNSLFVDLVRAGAGLTLVVEYWNGATWVDVSVGSEYFLDNTDNLTQVGNITWNTSTMSDWTPVDLNGSGTAYYYMRYRTSSSPTIAPITGGLSRGSSQRFAIYNSTFDVKPSFYVDALGRTNIGGGNITGKNKLQVNTGNNVQVTATGTDSLVEFDSEDSSAVDLKIKLASNDACAPGLTFVKTRGTLDVSSCTAHDDLLGRISFRGRAGATGRLLAEMGSQFTGSGTTRCGDIFFKTANGSDPVERVRIDYKGDTGFGVPTPSAVVHLCAGTASHAPLKFTSGSLVATPQAGAVEFLNDKFYGTTTGGTRQVFAFICDTSTINLQSVTEAGSCTNVETTFSGGLVISEIRPSGDTVSAITVNKADGVTPVMIIDTVSGLTGFGIQPLNKIHTYGTDNGGDLLASHKNGIIIDGVVDGDKDLVWHDGGAPKWYAEIYRNEEGKYWYLYNNDGDISPLTVSESGRIGVNSLTDIIDYPPQSISGTPYNTGLQISGLYDKGYIGLYQVRIDSTTGATDTYQWRKSIDLGVNYTVWSSSSGCTTGATIIDSGVEVTFVDVTGFTVGDAWKFPAFPQLPPATFAIVGNRLNKVLATDDYTVSAMTYIDLTAEANTSIVDVPTELFRTGVTTNAAYIGTYTKLNSLFINVYRGGAGITFIGEYWNGSSWVNITTDGGYFNDGTNNLSRTGSVSWNVNALTTWTYGEPPELAGEGDYYWMRFRTSSPSTTSPLIGGASRGSVQRLAVYSSALDYKSSFYVDALGRTNIGGGNISGCNLLQINCSNYVDVTGGQSNSLLEIDSNCSSIANMRIRSSSDDSISGGYVIAKTRGTLESPTNICSGDSIGHVCFRARVNNAGTYLGSIDTQYVGDSTTCYIDILFKTASGSAPTEKVRISTLGTGFGVSSPTAVVHLKAGTASTAPLKFTSGSLLGSPQAGAVEFLGNKWYGTTTGSTRRTFAFLESPVFLGSPELPAGTTLNSINLNSYILNSGGTNNALLLQKSVFVSYTGATNTRLNGVDNDIDYISGVTDTKLPTATFAAYTGGTIPWVKVDKTGSNLADLATRNAGDVNYVNTDWDETDAAGMLDKLGQYIEDTQISGRLSPENVLYQTGLNELYIDAGSGYITYDTFHRFFTWSAQTFNTSGLTLSGDVGTHYVYFDTNGDLQVTMTEPDNIHNIRLGSFYWALQIGNVKQDGGVISNAVARASDYFRRMGYFIYDNGGNIQLLSAGTTTIVSTPCKIQMGLMPVDLPQVATTLADISGLTMMVNYNSPDQGVNADFYYINKSFYYGDASIPTTYYNDPQQPSGLVLTAYTFNFTYGSNIVTSPDDVRSVLPTGDTFRIYDAFDGDTPYIYENLVTGHTWDGTGTTLTLAIPYSGTGGTGHTAVVSLSTKNIPPGKWVKSLVLRTTGGQLAFYLAQTYYNTKEEAIAGALPAKIPPFDTTTLNMAYIVYSAGSTTFNGEIYDVRPLPFSYQLGGQSGGGGGISNHGDLSGLDADDHLQYLRTDGTRNLTGVQRYQSHPTFTLDTQLVDRKYVNDQDALNVTKTAFNAFTGNTYTKSEINAYTGATSTRIGIIESNYITGATNLGQGYELYYGKTDKNLQFKSLSAGTTNVVLSCTSNKVVISVTGGTTSAVWGYITGNITGQTDLNNCLNARVTDAEFSTFTGTTLPANYYNKTQINAYSAATDALIDTKAPIISPTFLVGACAPTPVVDSNNTCIATTAFVVGQASSLNPLMDGSVSIGTSLRYSRQDHVHPSDTSRLSVANFSTFTGTTLPANYYNKTQINAYTAQTNTLIGTKASQSNVAIFTGTTLPANYYNKTQINAYSAATKSEIDLKAPITSPTFLVSACAPTPIADSNNTCIATTAFITSCQVGTAAPLMNGAVAVGTSLRYSRQDHVHPRDLTKVYVSGDTMTGTLRTSGGFLAAGLVSGSTVYGSTCLCSAGATRLVGATTAASTLNVSGATKLSSVGRCQVVFGNPTTCQLTGNTGMVYNASAGTLCVNYLQTTASNAYLYAERSGDVTNATTTCCKYIGVTGTTMPAGTYAVDFSGIFGVTGSNNEVNIKFGIDNTVVGKNMMYRMSSASAVSSASIIKNSTLTAGTHCFDIWFWETSGTACETFGSVRVRRIC